MKALAKCFTSRWWWDFSILSRVSIQAINTVAETTNTCACLSYKVITKDGVNCILTNGRTYMYNRVSTNPVQHISRRFPGEILGKFQEMFMDIYSAWTFTQLTAHGLDSKLKLCKSWNINQTGISILIHNHQVSSKCDEIWLITGVMSEWSVCCCVAVIRIVQILLSTPQKLHRMSFFIPYPSG